MREVSSKIIFIVVDTMIIYLSIFLAFLLRDLTSDIFDAVHTLPLSLYFTFYMLTATPILLFFYEGIL